MSALVTLEQLKLYVQQSDSHDDLKLRMLAGSASRMVLRYLKLPESAYQDSNGEMEESSDTVGYVNVPEDVQCAVLYLAALIYRDPDGVESDKWTPGYLPAPVVSMLYSLRTPTLA